MRELRDAGVRLIGLTNWPAGIFAPALERFSFLSWFDGIVVSGDEKIAKPDAAIFRLLLDRYDVDPTTAAYVDDTAGHVETARSLRMAAFVYTGAPQLRRDFASAGLPVAADVDCPTRDHRRPGSDHRDLQPLRDQHRGHLRPRSVPRGGSAGVVLTVRDDRSVSVLGRDPSRPGGRIRDDVGVSDQAGLRPVGRGDGLPASGRGSAGDRVDALPAAVRRPPPRRRASCVRRDRAAQ